MAYKNIVCDKHQGGFTLLELLLVVGISAVLLLGIVSISDMWAKSIRAEQAGQHIEMVRQVAEEYLRSEGVESLTAAAAANSGIITNVTNFTDYLPDGANSLENPLGVDTNVRLIQNGSRFEIYIHTTGTPIPNDLLIPSGSAIGAYGGTLSRVYTAATSVRSSFGTWTAPLENFQYTDNVDVTDNGGQLAAFISISRNEIIGPYLYRTQIDCDGDGALDEGCNTMDTDLIMGNNDITGVGDMAVAGLTAGSANVSGNLTVVGGATFNGNLTVDGDLNAATLNSNTATITTATIEGSLSSASINAGTITTGDAEVSGLSVGVLTVTNTANVGANNFTVAPTGATITVNGTLEAGNISADSATVSGALGTQDINVHGGVTVTGGDVDLQGGDMIANDIGIEGCLTITGDPNSPYGTCN